MATFVAIALVVIVGWVVVLGSLRARSGDPARGAPPAWPGEDVSRPVEPPLTATPIAPIATPRPRLAPTVSAKAAPAPPRGLAALTQAQAVAVGSAPPSGYTFSSRPQRRRPDRSARLFAHARGPGLCSPRPKS